MGSGKTTVGRLVAGRLGYRFLDLDSLIVEIAGKNIREIFDEDGEEAFRQIETDALYSLREMNRLVIATGGGAPIRQENQEFFENLAATFYLEVSFHEFLARTGRDRARPLLDRSATQLEDLYASRLPVYRSLGDRILTDSRNPGEIAEQILKKFEAL
jgi:shikimate kinase